MDSQQSISIKLYFKNAQQFRKFSIASTTSLQQFLIQIQKILGLKALSNEDVEYVYKLDYLDEFGDWIYLLGWENETNSANEEREEQWKEALSTSKKTGLLLNVRVAIQIQESLVGQQKRVAELEKKRKAEEEKRRKWIEEQQKRREEYLKQCEAKRKEQEKRREEWLKQRQEHNTESNLEDVLESLFDGFFFGPHWMKSKCRQQKNAAKKQEQKTEEPKNTVPQQVEQQQVEQQQQVEESPKEEPKVESKLEEDEPIIETIPSTSSTMDEQHVEEEQQESGTNTELNLLESMGFGNMKLNQHLLNQFNNDISKVVQSLLQLQSL